MLDRAVRDYLFADRFGWTPSQVDNESRIRMRGIGTVAEVVAELRGEAERNAARKHRN